VAPLASATSEINDNGNRSADPKPRTQPKQAAALGIPFLQKFHVGSYLIRQQLSGRKRYPLVLMLEPLFRCNLACA
jgi:hypothetical protein